MEFIISVVVFGLGCSYSFSSSISHITVPSGSGHWIVFVFGSQSLSSTMFLCFAGISGSMLASA